MDKDIITITTDGDGAGSAKTKNMLGKVAAIVYTKPASGGFANNVVILAKTVRTGITIWSETLADSSSKTVFPRTKTHTTLGAEILYADAKNVYDQVPVVNDEVEITISAGGDTLAGAFEVILA